MTGQAAFFFKVLDSQKGDEVLSIEKKDPNRSQRSIGRRT